MMLLGRSTHESDALDLMDPIQRFSLWFRAAADRSPGSWFDPSAMTLATCGRNGDVTARMVLLKTFGPEGFVFYTNYSSRKGHPKIHMRHWYSIGRICVGKYELKELSKRSVVRTPKHTFIRVRAHINWQPLCQSNPKLFLHVFL
jgi:hypothetical protein